MTIVVPSRAPLDRIFPRHRFPLGDSVETAGPFYAGACGHDTFSSADDSCYLALAGSLRGGVDVR